LGRGDQAAALTTYRKALATAEEVAVKMESLQTANGGKPDAATGEDLAHVAWRAIFAREFARALAASERTRVLAPALAWPHVDHAHALLYLGRMNEARDQYLAHKGKPHSDQRSQRRREAARRHGPIHIRRSRTTKQRGPIRDHGLPSRRQS
jgi:hypothetical protein